MNKSLNLFANDLFIMKVMVSLCFWPKTELIIQIYLALIVSYQKLNRQKWR